MSSSTDNEIKDAYDKFWSRRDAIKQRHKRELEEDSADARRELAKAIWSARRSNEKYTVQDVADLLGLKNRNFLYKVMNDVPLNDPESATGPVGRPSGAAKKRDKPKSKELFHLRWDRTFNTAGEQKLVTIHNTATGSILSYAVEFDDEGHIAEIPEGWYVDTLTPDEVEFYKDLIQQIESAHNV